MGKKMNRSLKTIQKIQSRAFFKKMPMATVKDHLDMYGPTSIQKIEYESYLAGLGVVPWTFMMWADGDGESGDNMTRSPYSGEYFKVIPFEMPEIECADHHSGH